MDFSTMDTNILAVIISSLIYVLFAILNWCRQKIVIWYTNKKMFKTYKEYAIEFLEACISSEFYIFSEVYSFDQLKVVLEQNPRNLVFNIFSKPNEELIPIYALGFISKKYMLEFKELWLLRYILDNMSEENKWFFRDHTLVQGQIEFQVYHTSFSSFSVQDKYDNTLFFFINDCNMVLTKNTDITKLKTLLTKLKHGKFDGRIKKIIKKGVQE